MYCDISQLTITKSTGFGMKEIVNRLEKLINKGKECISQSPEVELSRKYSPEKWSKKEILGHLIDSGINNLQRFTEI